MIDPSGLYLETGTGESLTGGSLWPMEGDGGAGAIAAAVEPQQLSKVVLLELLKPQVVLRQVARFVDSFHQSVQSAPAEDTLPVAQTDREGPKDL